MSIKLMYDDVVVIVKGKYKGCIGYYDDDDSDTVIYIHTKYKNMDICIRKKLTSVIKVVNLMEYLGANL